MSDDLIGYASPSEDDEAHAVGDEKIAVRDRLRSLKRPARTQKRVLFLSVSVALLVLS